MMTSQKSGFHKNKNLEPKKKNYGQLYMVSFTPISIYSEELVNTRENDRSKGNQ